MLHLILTLDYEVFGNGSGDVLRDVVEPTNRILDICDRHRAKLTIMFEVAEYWSFMRAEQEGNISLPFSPSGRMRAQAEEALRRGHDVQLHLHPQWIGAELVGGVWSVKNAQWRIADLPHGLGSEDDPLSITGAMRQGKQSLEEILRPIDPEYRCIAFRAGGFLAQPAESVIQAMKSVGLVADSSVVRGLKTEPPRQVDYTRAPSSVGFWWTSATDFCAGGDPGMHVLEFPIYALRQPYLTNFKPRKLWTTLKRHRLERQIPGTKNAGTTSREGLALLRKLFSMHPVTVDFCKLNARDLFQSVIREFEQVNEGTEIAKPLTLIGHCKDFWNDKNLDRFLGRMARLTAEGAPLAFKTLRGSIAEIHSSPIFDGRVE